MIVAFNGKKCMHMKLKYFEDMIILHHRCRDTCSSRRAWTCPPAVGVSVAEGVHDLNQLLVLTMVCIHCCRSFFKWYDVRNKYLGFISWIAFDFFLPHVEIWFCVIHVCWTGSIHNIVPIQLCSDWREQSFLGPIILQFQRAPAQNEEIFYGHSMTAMLTLFKGEG